MGNILGGDSGKSFDKFGSREEINAYAKITDTVPLSVKLPMATEYRKPNMPSKASLPPAIAIQWAGNGPAEDDGEMDFVPTSSTLSGKQRAHRVALRDYGYGKSTKEPAVLPGVWDIIVTDHEGGNWGGFLVFLSSGFARVRFEDGTAVQDFRYKVNAEATEVTADVPGQGWLEVHMYGDFGQGWFSYNEVRMARRWTANGGGPEDYALGAWAIFSPQSAKIGVLEIDSKNKGSLIAGASSNFDFVFRGHRLEALGLVQDKPLWVDFTPDGAFAEVHMMDSKFEAWHGNPESIEILHPFST